MGRVRGEERKRVVEEYKKTREKVKKILRKKEKRRQQEKNEKLENFRGRNEREYWKYLKNLIGIKKKEERLPEEVQIGDRVERGEKRKEVWNEAFSKLGKFDLEDKNFDKQAYISMKQQVEKWEREKGERERGERTHKRERKCRGRGMSIGE